METRTADASAILNLARSRVRSDIRLTCSNSIARRAGNTYDGKFLETAMGNEKLLAITIKGRATKTGNADTNSTSLSLEMTSAVGRGTGLGKTL